MNRQSPQIEITFSNGVLNIRLALCLRAECVEEIKRDFFKSFYTCKFTAKIQKIHWDLMDLDIDLPNGPQDDAVLGLLHNFNADLKNMLIHESISIQPFENVVQTMTNPKKSEVRTLLESSGLQHLFGKDGCDA